MMTPALEHCGFDCAETSVTMRKAPRPARRRSAPTTSAPLALDVGSLPPLVADLTNEQRSALAEKIAKIWDQDLADDGPRQVLAAGLKQAFDEGPGDPLFTHIAERRWLDLIGGYLRSLLQLGRRMLDPDERGVPRIARMTLELLARHALDADEIQRLEESFRRTDSVRLWWGNSTPFAAEALVVAQRILLDARTTASKCPAIPSLVVAPLARALSGSADVRDDRGLRIVVAGRERIATLEPTELSKEAALRALSSVHAHRLLRFLVARVWEQNVIDRKPDAAIVRVREGWSGLAAAVGVHGRRGANALKQTGEVLAALRLDGDAPGPLMRIDSHRVRNREGAHSTMLAIEVIGALTPGYVYGLRGTGLDSKLIPLPHVVGPLTKGTKTHAAQCSLQMLFLQELHIRAREFDERRFVVLPPTRLEELGREVGLSAEGVGSCVDAWVAGGFVQRKQGSRYRLSERFSQIDQHIAQFEAISRGARARRARRRK